MAIEPGTRGYEPKPKDIDPTSGEPGATDNLEGAQRFREGFRFRSSLARCLSFIVRQGMQPESNRILYARCPACGKVNRSQALDCPGCGARLFSEDGAEHAAYIRELKEVKRKYFFLGSVGVAIAVIVVSYALMGVITGTGFPIIPVVAALAIDGAWAWKQIDHWRSIETFLASDVNPT